MYKYKIMIIDDQIRKRIDNLSDFFTNVPLDKNEKMTQAQKEAYKKQIGLEFEVVYPYEHEILDEYVKANKADAYFLDVYLENQEDPENNVGWNLGKALSAIYKYNPKAPIFMYSTDWRDKDVLKKVTDEFRQCFPGKTASYFYDLNNIEAIVDGFREAVHQNQIERISRERTFIKNMIVRAYGKTEKEPFSKDKDVAILHISDIQYGDRNTTEYNMSLWAEVARVCKDLKKKGTISGIDLLAVTGDISMHGKSEEFEMAVDDLEKDLFKKLWEDEYESKKYQERILLVPGNHDYDLNFCTADYLVSENGPNKGDRTIDFEKAGNSLLDENRKKINNYHALGLTAYKDFAYHMTGNPVYYEKKHLNYVENRYTSWNIRLICLNTCGGICAEKTNGIKIDQDEMKEIINSDYDDKCYTIVLSHHSPLFEKEMKGEEKDRFRVNCTSIINTCRGNVWLGGHRHIQKDEARLTTAHKAEIYDASTVSLKENWASAPDYEVQTVDGKMVKSRRGFQIIILKNDQKGSYEPSLIKYVFDEDGVAWEVRG